jgi:uncharacterized membrane protein
MAFPESRDVINLVIAVVGSTGFFGGIYALLKLRPEAGQITVTAAQGAIIVQTGVIDNLRKELTRILEENARVIEENRVLKERLEMLENKLRALTERTRVIEEK